MSCPSAMGARSISIGAPAAIVEASGFIWETNGQSVATPPTAAAHPVATKRKSRRVGCSAEDAVVTITAHFQSATGGHAHHHCHTHPGATFFCVLCFPFDVAAHIIEPAGFPVSDRHFRRAGMDYLDQVSIMRHDSWSKFEQWRNDKRYRLILFTTKAVSSYLDYRYSPADILLFGRESAGVPDVVVAAADARLVIPIKPGFRSLNVALAAAMALGEALRQTNSAIVPQS